MLLVALSVQFNVGVAGDNPPVVLLLHFVTPNIALLVFNMIPVPLDGSKVLYAFCQRDRTEI